MSLKERVLADLAAAGCAPLHRYGQHFLIDRCALDSLCAALPLAPGAQVVEIGPGTGLLTERLLQHDAHIVAVEIDRGLAAFLARRWAGRKLTVVHGDALRGAEGLHPAITAVAAAGPWLFASNLPYDIAIPAILEAAALPRPPSALAATVQLACAERLCSRPGDAAWGASAAILQAAGSPRLLRRVGRAAFHPQPRVDSALIAWEPRQPLPPGFAAWVRRVFAYRRKVLIGALRDAGHHPEVARQACAAAGIAAEHRLEQLDSSELLALHRALHRAP
ncbi:MAG: rRNA adenine dimethyltransferase family protein [Planctomycetota bacterium]|nr:rRNA adenine dimethyltransferase family protein [Planctomycetota bacterium]